MKFITVKDIKLGESIRLLGEMNGYMTYVYPIAKDGYKIELFNANGLPRSHVDDQHNWYEIWNVSNALGEKEVYSLSVEEDRSYVVDGVVVGCAEVLQECP